MEKRSSIHRDDLSRLEWELSEIDKENEKQAVLEPERIAIRNLIPSLVTWRSPKTGELYQWDSSGSEVKVLAEDVDFLLAHRRRGCCGAPESPSFELV